MSVDTVTVSFQNRVLATLERRELRAWLSSPSPRLAVEDVGFIQQRRHVLMSIGMSSFEPLSATVLHTLRSQL